MIIDIIVLVILLISAGIAFMRGFIREVLTIAGVVGGLAAAYFGGPMLKLYMRGWFGVEEGIEPERLFGVLPYDILADALSYGLIFIVVVTVLSFVSHSLAEWARRTGLGAVDRSMGFLFGLVRGLLLLGILYLPVYLFIDKDVKEGWFKNTKSQFYLEKISAGMASYLPEETQQQAEAALAEAEKAANARDKLKQIDLLHDGSDASGQDDIDVDLPNASPEPAIKNSIEGYDDSFRDDMDQLIEETSRKVNE